MNKERVASDVEVRSHVGNRLEGKGRDGGQEVREEAEAMVQTEKKGVPGPEREREQWVKAEEGQGRGSTSPPNPNYPSIPPPVAPAHSPCPQGGG